MRCDSDVKAAGFSLMEATISMIVLALLVTSVFSITVESTALLGDIDVEYVVQMDGSRALTQITDILHKTGRMEDDGVLYPRVLADASVLEFRIPEDLDGNGYPFDGTTGAIEWNPNVFSIKADGNGNLSVYRSGTEVYPIAHHVSSVHFETALENPTLHLTEISIELEIRKTLKSEDDVVFLLTGTVHMRN